MWHMVQQQVIDDYERDGFAIARSLFSQEEVAFYLDYYMAMVHRGGDGWAEGEVDSGSDNPLKRYPRLLQPHRGDEVSFKFMVDPRIREHLTALLGETPFAVQTMVYFKPPGALGQALHQDQRYLRVQPGTCMAAWLALDDCDEENGCMMMVPGSQELPVLCPGASNPEESWSGDEVPIPPGLKPVPAVMKAGDVVFFNGQVIHGSNKNRSQTRFRRIVVGHYIAAEAEKVSHYYFPVFNMDGTLVEGLDSQEWGDGGPCGYIRDTEGGLAYEMVGSIKEATSAH